MRVQQALVCSACLVSLCAALVCSARVQQALVCSAWAMSQCAALVCSVRSCAALGQCPRASSAASAPIQPCTQPSTHTPLVPCPPQAEEDEEEEGGEEEGEDGGGGDGGAGGAGRGRGASSSAGSSPFQDPRGGLVFGFWSICPHG